VLLKDIAASMLTNLDLQINANEVFESAIESNHDILSYCQSVESIMKYATKFMSNYTFYTSIVIDGLTQQEIEVLLYFGLSSYGTQFKPLAEKYGLFQNFQMISPALKNITVQYSNDAFKEMSAESDKVG
jgi:hypothetical protein